MLINANSTRIFQPVSLWDVNMIPLLHHLRFGNDASKNRLDFFGPFRKGSLAWKLSFAVCQLGIWDWEALA